MATMEELFSTRRWRVYAEADGAGGDAGFGITFRLGHFKVDSPAAFMSPLGNAGRSGVVLQEVGSDGKDIEDSLAAVGDSVAAKAKAVYHAIT